MNSLLDGPNRAGISRGEEKAENIKSWKKFCRCAMASNVPFLRKAENSLTSNHYVQFPTFSSPFIPVFFPFGLLRPQWKVKEFSGRVIFDDLVLCSENRKKLEGCLNYGVLNKLFIVLSSILALCFIQLCRVGFNDVASNSEHIYIQFWHNQPPFRRFGNSFGILQRLSVKLKATTTSRYWMHPLNPFGNTLRGRFCFSFLLTTVHTNKNTIHQR